MIKLHAETVGMLAVGFGAADGVRFTIVDVVVLYELKQKCTKTPTRAGGAAKRSALLDAACAAKI